MTDTTFRTKQEPAKQVAFNEPKNPTNTDIESSVHVPYTEYESSTGKPYTADLYELGDYWEAYSKELGNVEGYFQEKVKSGDIANDTKAIKSEIKKLEKLLNLKDETRASVKIGVLNEHVKFLLGVKAIKNNAIKYGSSK